MHAWTEVDHVLASRIGRSASGGLTNRCNGRSPFPFGSIVSAQGLAIVKCDLVVHNGRLIPYDAGRILTVPIFCAAVTATVTGSERSEVRERSRAIPQNGGRVDEDRLAAHLDLVILRCRLALWGRIGDDRLHGPRRALPGRRTCQNRQQATRRILFATELCCTAGWGQRDGAGRFGWRSIPRLNRIETSVLFCRSFPVRVSRPARSKRTAC